MQPAKPRNQHGHGPCSTRRAASIAAAVLGLIVLGVFVGSGAGVAPVAAGGCESTDIAQWEASQGGNGHFYQGICADDGINWQDAQDNAELLGGQLASITSEEENSFVFDLIDEAELWEWYDEFDWCGGPWIGGLQEDGAQEPAGGWAWVSGEPFTYDAWNAGEPDNFGGGENRVTFANLQCASGLDTAPNWSDVGLDSDLISYVIEWTSEPPACMDTPVTEFPFTAGGHGHYYQGVCAPEGITWDDASDLAEEMGGYLVSVTSEAENNFVFDLTASRFFWQQYGDWCPGPLIGLYEPDGTKEPDGGWLWASGEPFGYENWAAGQPNNNDNVDENRALYGNGDCDGVFANSNDWHDFPDDDFAPAFVIEWDELPAVFLQGDVQCDGDVDSVDALQQLRDVASLETFQEDGCPQIGLAGGIFGDVDCDGDVDSVDALKVLRHVAALSVTQTEPCTAIGEPL